MIFFNAQQQPITKPAEREIFWRLCVYPLVTNEQGKVLVVTPVWNPQWELPGGGVEMEEDVITALKRECLEESGYQIEIIQSSPFYVGEQYYYSQRVDKFYHAIHLMYRAKLLKPEQDKSQINANGLEETAKVAWLPLDKLTPENCHPIHWPAIKLFKEEMIKEENF